MVGTLGRSIGPPHRKDFPGTGAIAGMGFTPFPHGQCFALTGDDAMPYDPKKHHRRSIRLAGYDYTQPGAYFVTLCTQDRAPILGDLTTTAVTLSPVGEVVQRCWLALPHHFPQVELDAWVIMPDHFHAIVVLGAAPVSQEPMPKALAHGTRPDSLAAVIQNFKSVSTRRTNQLRTTAGASLWQRDYYERIVRTPQALDTIRQYIAANPARAFAQAGRT